MATPTYYFSDILNLIKRSLPSNVESDASAYIANSAINEIWRKYDWRGSLKILPPFYLIPGAQDHGAPAVCVPSDFLGLRAAQLVQLSSSPFVRKDLGVTKSLQLTNFYGMPADLDYEPQKQAFRVFPRVPQNIGTPLYCIQGTYKKQSPKVTADTLSSTLLPFDDLYFSNLVEVFKWSGWKFAGDPRAGGVQASKGGGTQFTGQFAVAYAAIEDMAENEGLEGGDPYIAPAEPLYTTYRNFWGGPYGRYFTP